LVLTLVALAWVTA